MFNGMNGLEILKNWPRYESGELVRIGDEFIDHEDLLRKVERIVLMGDGYLLVSKTGTYYLRRYGQRVRRPAPAVLASDGEPLEVGQTVWDVDAEADTPLTVVEVSSDLVRCEYTWKDGKTYRPCYPPNQLTHEHPDSWQRIEEDVMVDAKDYCESRGISSEYPKHSGKAKCEDLVRRCRALAERERGE